LSRRFDVFHNWVVDEGRITRGDQRHRVAAVQEHVQVGRLLSEGDEHRASSRGDFHQEPIPVPLLAYDLTFDLSPDSADRLWQVRGKQRGAAIGRADTHGHPDEERAEEDHPSPHGTFTRDRRRREEPIEKDYPSIRSARRNTDGPAVRITAAITRRSSLGAAAGRVVGVGAPPPRAAALGRSRTPRSTTRSPASRGPA